MERKAELERILHTDERVVEQSQRKPRLFVGISCLLVGAVLAGNALLRARSGAAFLPDLAAGALLLYAALWTLVLCTRELVCVTTERVLYLRVGPFGRPRSCLSFPLRDIRKARLCKTISFRQFESGEVLLVLDGREYVLPPLKNGLFVLDAVRAERADLAVAARECGEGTSSSE